MRQADKPVYYYIKKMLYGTKIPKHFFLHFFTCVQTIQCSLNTANALDQNLGNALK